MKGALRERAKGWESVRIFLVPLRFDQSYLVLLGSLLSQSQDSGNADSKVVATNEVCLALLDGVPVLL